MQPPMDQQRAFWDKWIPDSRGPGRQDEASLRRRTEVLNHLKRLNLPAPTILEVGCANGWLCADLAQFGEVTGTDLAPKSIELAKAAHPHITFIAGDFYTVSMPRPQYDVVVCVDSIASVADHEPFFAKMASYVRTGGHLILTSQNPFIFSRYSGLTPLDPGQVRNWASRSRLKQLLKMSGFRLLEMKTVMPLGEQGILRVINSYKLNRIARALLGNERVRALKERANLGQTIITLSQRQA